MDNKKSVVFNNFDIKLIHKLSIDPYIYKIVKFIELAHLSILELLEFGISIDEINHALSKQVIEFDRLVPCITSIMESDSDRITVYNYNNLNQVLSCKVVLSELGKSVSQYIRILDEEEEQLISGVSQVIKKSEFFIK